MTTSFRAPGRVNLIGEHTDYEGGLVLPVAIHLGIDLRIEPAAHIALVSEDEHVKLDADGSGAARGWGRYVAAIAQELAALGRRPPVLNSRVAQSHLSTRTCSTRTWSQALSRRGRPSTARVTVLGGRLATPPI